jgi:hypothetical protein
MEVTRGALGREDLMPDEQGAELPGTKARQEIIFEREIRFPSSSLTTRSACTAGSGNDFQIPAEGPV